MGTMLRAQERLAATATCECCSWPGCPLYNEVLLSAETWVSRLPHTIEAIFVPVGASPEAEAQARRVHQYFRATYRLQASEGPPLVRVNRKAHAPFELVVG